MLHWFEGSQLVVPLKFGQQTSPEEHSELFWQPMFPGLPPPPPPPEKPPPLEKPELEDLGAGSDVVNEPAIALVTEFIDRETLWLSNTRPEYQVGA